MKKEENGIDSVNDVDTRTLFSSSKSFRDAAYQSRSSEVSLRYDCENRWLDGLDSRKSTFGGSVRQEVTSGWGDARSRKKK